MKLQTIVDTLASRLANILIASGYYTDIGKNVYRGKGQIPDEKDGVSIYLNPRTAEETKGDRQKVSASVTVEAIHDYSTYPETLAIKLLADIQTALEVSDSTLDSLLNQPGFQFISDEISYPENSDSKVAVSVTYSIPHIRHYGDADS